MANNYKVPGKKMKTRFMTSHREMRELVKKGILPGAAETKAYGRDPSMTRKQWTRLHRMSNRQIRVMEKGLPMYDMDGSYYHG